VGLPPHGNCGACHFLAGGGNAVKHGALDESLLFPNPEIDVHMGRLGFHCVDCHQAEDHLPPGRLLTVSVDDKNRLFCTDCHKGEQIHGDRRIDDHADRIACQTCHIPLMATKTGTKLSWDWSAAGQDLPITNEHLYLKIKGRFTWVRGAQPEYAWYNGTGERYLLGDKIDPESVTAIAAPLGDRDDPKAKLYPFKIHRGRQVYDTEHKHFILPHVYGDKGFWTQFDWDDALRVGTEVTGLPFSGRYDFAPTKMYLPQNHMVAPKEKALQCPDCHGPGGRMHWRRLGYSHDPIARPSFVHEPIPLLDADGEMVHESGNPLSASMTCSQCHEIEEPEFFATHAYHSTLSTATLVPERRALMQQGPGLPSDEAQQMNCFLCHLDRPNLSEWQAAIQSGRPDWAVAGTLIGTRMGLKGTAVIEHTDQGYRWNSAALDDDDFAVIPMTPPRPEHCGNCHGLVHTDTEPLLVKLGSGEHWATETTGQVFSAQRIRLSALNLRGKDALGRAWDLHAQRLVECRDCHYSKTVPERTSTGGAVASETHAGGGLRDCDSCHVNVSGHDWLPERQKHFAAVACESCHAPRAYLPARKQVDATVVTPDGNPLLSYRGLAQGTPDDLARGFSVGYQPLLMETPNHEGADKWTPLNLVSHWYWVAGPDGVEIDRAQLRDAWSEGGHYRPEVVALFDADGNGALGHEELILDRADKVALIRSLLAAQGVTAPEIKAEVRAYPMHHGVALVDANRDCARCHAVSGAGDFELADHLPGGVLPSVFHGLPASFKDTWRASADGGLSLPRPVPLSDVTVDSQEKR
jgi:hypothetical protein